MTHTTTHSQFKEALRRAYVRGWYDGLDGIKNDDKKIDVADELARQYPTEAAALQLLGTCKWVLQEIDWGHDMTASATILQQLIAKAKLPNK